MAKRTLPWRKTKAPYTIWVSEIILQQTRVEQGLPYFLRFIEAFPTVQSLARASEDEVLRQWEGLGYYSRARNMQAAAKQIVNEFGGSFPTAYAEIIKLKGIGPYTAAAISSICFDEAEPVVDGNVFRAASRIFGIHEDISKASTRKTFVSTLKSILPEKDIGTFNQAMMEFGATLCKPTPSCNLCPVREFCHAYEKGMVNQLPVNGKKLIMRDRYFNYLVYQHEEKLLLKKRSIGDIWQGLYDFPLIEGKELKGELDEMKSAEISKTYIHLLSHQKLHIRFVHQVVSEKEMNAYGRTHDAKPYSLKQMLNLPKPKIVLDYVQQRFDEDL